IDLLVSEQVGIRRRAIAHADDPVLAPLPLEHRDVADDQAQADERLRDDTVAVIALLLVAARSRGAEADAEQRRALQRDRTSEPPLREGPEPKSGRPPANPLRREILVPAEQTPDAAIILTPRVLGAEQHATNREVLDGVRRRIRVRHRGELEEEKIEGTLVRVTRLTREPVVHVEVEAPVLLAHVRRKMRVVDARGERCPDPKTEVHRGIVARKDRLKPGRETKPVEAEPGRQHRRAELAPEAGSVAAALEQQARH